MARAKPYIVRSLDGMQLHISYPVKLSGWLRLKISLALVLIRVAAWVVGITVIDEHEEVT